MVNANNAERSWGSRRMNKQAKYDRFEAQQQLEIEIRARHHMQEEMRKLRSRNDELENELLESHMLVCFNFFEELFFTTYNIVKK